VRSCKECGFEFLDEEAELARHAAVCDHLGVLKPAEIRGLRERYQLSRAEFANLTRVGEATLARWETGIVIQNKAYDEYLRLLQDPMNMKKLTQRLGTASPNAEGIAPPAPRFRCVGNEHRGAQRTFELRRSRAA
jgi:DNA-binding transcriptional regulator YiaG